MTREKKSDFYKKKIFFNQKCLWHSNEARIITAALRFIRSSILVEKTKTTFE